MDIFHLFITLNQNIIVENTTSKERKKHNRDTNRFLSMEEVAS
jgi:hypothetical protein